jgi:hypothetical protein
MSGQIPRPRSITLVATLLGWSISIAASTITARADDCLAEPNSPAPTGSHWYYHFDKATQRKCWYIHAKDQSVQPAAAQATSDRTSLLPAAAIPLDKPATASASGPISISPGDSTPPVPRVKLLAVKPQRPSLSTATTTNQPVQQSAQKGTPQGNAALAIPEAPAPEANTSQQASDQGAAHASAAKPAWPDPPVMVMTQDPTAPSSDTQTESARPPGDAAAADDVESTARGSVSTTNAVKTTASVAWAPVEMFPIAALGLVVAGFLLRIVMKISARRRQRIVIDHPDSDLIDDRQEHESRDDQSPPQPDGLGDYLRDSVIPTATDSNPRRPFRDEQPDARGRDPASRFKSKISTRKYRRVGVDAREPDWIDDQHKHESHDDQPPHQRDRRTDDLQRLSIPTATDSRSTRSFRVDDERPDNAPGGDPISRVQEKITREYSRSGVDSRKSVWIDDRHQLEESNNPQRVETRDELIDDLQSSLIQASSDYRPRPPLQADDGSSDNGRGKNGASPSSDEIREREEVLERLRRDLDRLLQSPKVA